MKLPHYIQVTTSTEYGDSKFCRIRLNPNYKDNAGLVAHEYTHVKQWYVGLVVGLALTLFVYIVFGRVDSAFYALILAPFWKDLAYTFIKPCRLFLEVQAFAKQINVEPTEHHEYYVKAYAKSLVDNYNLSITEDVAELRLRAKIK